MNRTQLAADGSMTFGISHPLKVSQEETDLCKMKEAGNGDHILEVHSTTTIPDRAGRVRVATYNIHKCRGLDGRIRPERIVEVLREIDADIVALQEVCCREGRRRSDHQARFIAEELGLHAELGENRIYRGGPYGNLLLSRLPIHHARNHDLSVDGRERRGCLRSDIRLSDDSVLHLFNVHLGTGLLERRYQARELFRRQVFTDPELPGCKIILGDFNEWTRGLPSKFLSDHFESANSRMQARHTRTFPGLLPILPLDYIYFDRGLLLQDVAIHRSRMALLASDHLPLVAEFSMPLALWDNLPPRYTADPLFHCN